MIQGGVSYYQAVFEDHNHYMELLSTLFKLEPGEF